MPCSGFSALHGLDPNFKKYRFRSYSTADGHLLLNWFTEVTRKLQWIVKSATYIGTEKNQWIIHADIIHAFTECDITSQFCSIRKGKAFKALIENHVFISVHKNMHVIISNKQDPKTTGQKSGLFSMQLEGKKGNFQIKEKPHC